jgi:GTP cyclohydrolase II
MRHSGVLVYLDQEGRGAGLWAKANAYRLYQEEGLDTFQAYEKLGIPADMRDYAGAAGILRELGITSAKLLTNNPEKAEALEQNGMTVTRVPLRMEPVPAAAAYLRAKKRHGHLLLLTAAWLSLAFHVRMWYSQPQEPGMEARDDNDVEWHGMHLAGG